MSVPQTARISNQSTPKEMNLEYSLEGLLLKLQHFGHLIQRADSLENTLMLGKIESRRRMVGWNHQFNGSELMRLVTLYRRQGSRPSPWKRKAKWLSGEGLQIAVKRREAKSKEEKEI